jgi:hypothetical protein
MKNTAVMLLILCNFAIGIYAGMFIQSFYKNELAGKQEMPEANERETVQVNAPYDRIQERSINVYADKIVIDLADLQGRKISWATYADTKSMVPTIGKGCNGLEFVPTATAEVHRGDMIAFVREDALIIHRVIDIGSDEQGWFVKTKGDNNQFLDEKIRFSQIKFVTFGIIC